MRIITTFVLVAFATPALAQISGSQLDDAHKICQEHQTNPGTAIPTKLFPSGYYAGYEHCVEVEKAWKDSDAAKRAKDTSDKDTLNKAFIGIGK